jgi:hypothetical protein
MKVLFLDLKGSYRDVNKQVFDALGINGVFSVFGFSLKLEENTYNHEDDFDYTLFISKDVINEIDTSDANENEISAIIFDLLNRNLKVKILMEDV